MTARPKIATINGAPAGAFFDDVSGGGPEAPGDDQQGCPVSALGRVAGAYYFSSPAGEVRELNAVQLCSRAGILSLFDGETDWLIQTFQVFDKDGQPIKGGWSHYAAGQYLMRACAALPLWDTATPLRGRGVWPIGGAGDAAAGVYVHVGHAVARHVPGVPVKWYRPGFREGGTLYRAMPPVVRPADDPGGTEIYSVMIETLSLWQYERASGPLVIAGWIAAATLGAAIPWRPHLLIVAREGCGKTWLDRFIEACLPLARQENDFSEAGIRQTMQDEARPLLLDEAEGAENGGGQGTVEAAIRLIRRLSDEGGLKSVRGSAGGTAHRFSANGSALLSAILPPVLLPQDASRFTRLDLLPLRSGAASEPVVAGTEAMRAAAPALWARMIEGRPRYLQNLQAVRRHLSDLGCSPRQADQPGAIIAGLATLESDAVIDGGRLAELVADLIWIVTEAQASTEEGGPDLCLNHLLSAQPDVWSGGARRTIGVMLDDALNGSGEARNYLAGIGIRVEPATTERSGGFYVANRFEALGRVFAGTQWAGGRWRDDLRRLPGAESRPPTRIAMAKVRATYLPAALLSDPVSGTVPGVPESVPPN